MRCRFIVLHKAIQRISNYSCDVHCVYNHLCNCRVVRKPVNTNPGLKVNPSIYFSYMKMFFTAYDLCSLRLFELKTEEQTK